jgi:hypothetical protein
MPDNYRRLVLCTSPSELPELVPGLLKSSSTFHFSALIEGFRHDWRTGRSRLGTVLTLSVFALIYLPAWLFRITIKSTAWFWLPIAYLGSDRSESSRPELFHWRNRHSLKAKVTYVLAAFSIASFIVTNILLAPDTLSGNPLLVVYGYLFLADWNLYPWQILSLLMAVVSLAILFWIDDLGGEYNYTKTHSPDQLAMVRRKFAMLEFVIRFRFVLWLLYMIIVGSQVLLYLNSKQCLVEPAPKLQQWATELYGKRTPPLCSEYRF